MRKFGVVTLTLVVALFSAMPSQKASAQSKEGRPVRPAAGQKAVSIDKLYIDKRIKDAAKQLRRQQEAREALQKAEEEDEAFEALDESENGTDDTDTADSDADAKKSAPKQAAGEEKASASTADNSSLEFNLSAPQSITRLAASDEAAGGVVITFDKRHTHFDAELRRLITNAERSRSVPQYSVISELPSGKRSTQNDLDQYQENLNAVLQKFYELGVNSERISVSSQTAKNGKSHTVKVLQN